MSEAPGPGPERDAYDAWRHDVFGDPFLVWRDGADTDELVRRARVDREGILDRLLEGLATGDRLPTRMLVVLGARDARVIDALERHARDAAPGVRIGARAALAHLDPGERRVTDLAQALATGSEFDRVDGLVDARGLPRTPALERMLLRLLEERDYLPQYHAAAQLLAWVAPGAELSEHPWFADVRSDSGRRHRALARTAAEALRAHPAA